MHRAINVLIYKNSIWTTTSNKEKKKSFQTYLHKEFYNKCLNLTCQARQEFNIKLSPRAIYHPFEVTKFSLEAFCCSQTIELYSSVLTCRNFSWGVSTLRSSFQWDLPERKQKTHRKFLSQNKNFRANLVGFLNERWQIKEWRNWIQTYPVRKDFWESSLCHILYLFHEKTCLDLSTAESKVSITFIYSTMRIPAPGHQTLFQSVFLEYQ